MYNGEAFANIVIAEWMPTENRWNTWWFTWIRGGLTAEEIAELIEIAPEESDADDLALRLDHYTEAGDFPEREYIEGPCLEAGDFCNQIVALIKSAPDKFYPFVASVPRYPKTDLGFEADVEAGWDPWNDVVEN